MGSEMCIRDSYYAGNSRNVDVKRTDTHTIKVSVHNRVSFDNEMALSSPLHHIAQHLTGIKRQ